MQISKKLFSGRPKFGRIHARSQNINTVDAVDYSDSAYTYIV